MAKRKRYTDEFRAGACLLLEAAGYPDTPGALKRTAEHLKMPEATLSRWIRNKNNPPPADLVTRKKVDLVELIRLEIQGALFAMGGERQNAGYRELATAVGILTDKLQLLTGKPTAQPGEQKIVIEYRFPDGRPAVSIPAPGRHHITPSTLQGGGDGQAFGEDDAGNYTH